MQIDVMLGMRARRDAQVVAGDDWSVQLMTYDAPDGDPVAPAGNLRLVIFKGRHDASGIDGVGVSPVVFDIPASKTRLKSGRWGWRIEQTVGDLRTTLMLGTLSIINPGKI